jgi:hypothetical protein
MADLPGFVYSKFWHGNMESDESDEEVDEEIIVEEGNPSTPELVATAAELDFSTQDLLQAEHELNEGIW